MAGRVHKPALRLRASFESSSVISSSISRASHYTQMSGPRLAPIAAKNGHRAPTSLEAELRLIIATANQSQAELRNFQNGYKLSSFNMDKIKDVGKEVLDILGVHDLSSIEEFRAEAKADRKREQTMRQKLNYDQLELLCDRAKDFEYCSEIRKRLNVTIKQHLCKYCLSFAEEAADVEIKCVKDYDNHIGQYKEKLEMKMSKVKELNEHYLKLKTPFAAGFLEHSEEITKIIDEVTESNLEMCNIMKKWAHEDKTYPQRLWDEIINGNVLRGKAMEDIKKYKRKKDDLGHQVTRREAIRDRAAERLENSKRESKKTKESKEVVSYKLEKEEKELQEKQKELAENDKRIADRKTNSPRFLEVLWGKTSVLKEDIEKIEERIDALKRQNGRLDKASQECDKAVQDLQEDLDSKTIDFHNYVDKLNDMNRELKNCTDIMQQREAKIAAAKKIREMKLSPTVLRKLHYDKLSPDQGRLMVLEMCYMFRMLIEHCWKVLHVSMTH